MVRKSRVLISQQEIEKALDRLAGQITHDYKGKRPLLIGILKGSFIFMADLVRRIKTPVEVDFIKISSYGSGTESSGKIKLLTKLNSTVKNRHVIVVEDIVDSGRTTSFTLDYLSKKRPASLKLCSLADKPSRRQVPVKIDYLGFSVPDIFIVGYGIDWDEKFRHLKDIRYIE